MKWLFCVSTFFKMAPRTVKICRLEYLRHIKYYITIIKIFICDAFNTETSYYNNVM